MMTDIIAIHISITHQKKLYVNVINLYIEKMVTETKTSLGTLKQNVIFRYGDCLV